MSDAFTRQPFASTSLIAAGYAPKTQILELDFKSGAVYRYSNVPAQTYAALLAADSKATVPASVSAGSRTKPSARVRRRGGRPGARRRLEEFAGV